MRKKCEHCGKFMSTKLHGACMNCLRSAKKLGPALTLLKESLDDGKYSGKTKKSVQNIINCANTLLFDGMWFAQKWNPLGNLKKVIDTAEERGDYLSTDAVYEIMEIVSLIESEEK